MNATRLSVLVLAACVGVAGASLAADRPVIVSESKLAGDWTPSDPNRPVPGYPSVVADKSENACVTIGYMINADGKTSDASLLKAWSSRQSGDDNAAVDPFARNAIAAVQRWSFVPAKKPRPTYTSTSFVFTADAANGASLRAKCEIDNLPAYVAKAQDEAYKRGNMQKGQWERERQNTRPLPAPGTKVN